MSLLNFELVHPFTEPSSLRLGPYLRTNNYLTGNPSPAGRKMESSGESSASGDKIKYLVFDIDDTLYPVTNGFTEHRLNDVFLHYCVERLGFECTSAAEEFRRPYFEKYHSSLKLLNVASAEGTLPPLEDGTRRVFDQDDLISYWTERCQFTTYIKPDPKLVQAFSSLRSEAPDLVLVAFSNGPRKYCLRILETLGIESFFEGGLVFAVDDILPLCKPQPEAFEKVLETIGCVNRAEAVMFEDSMKNIRAAKACGMRTVLIDAGDTPSFQGDSPDAADPAVDVVLRQANELKDRLPCLWEGRWAVV